MIEPIFTVLSPFFIHFFVVFFDKCLNFAYFPISQEIPVLQNTIPIAFDKEFCRSGFGQLSAAGVDVHTLYNTKRREIQEVASNLKLMVDCKIKLDT